MIYIGPDSKERMLENATTVYPDECCGFLFGAEDVAGDRTVTDILVVNNGKEGDKRRRFEITAADYRHAERHSEEQGLQLLGIYHSHPDHPPVPSEHDRVAAQPYFSYIIISVLKKEPDTIRSWRLNEEGQFEEELISDNPLA